MQGVPSLSSFNEALAYYNDTKPMRGTATRPLLTTRRHYDKACIALDAVGRVKVVHHTTAVAIFAPDRLWVSSYGSATTNELLSSLLRRTPVRHVGNRFGCPRTAGGPILGEYQTWVADPAAPGNYTVDPATVGVGIYSAQTVRKALKPLSAERIRWLDNIERVLTPEARASLKQADPAVQAFWGLPASEVLPFSLVAVYEQAAALAAGGSVNHLLLEAIEERLYQSWSSSNWHVSDLFRVRLAPPSKRPDRYIPATLLANPLLADL